MTVKIIEGSLFDSTAPVYCHGVNCQGAMGAGIAVWFKKYWPEMFEMYRASCRSRGTALMGDVQTYYVGGTPHNGIRTLWVKNCFTQPYPGKTATYSALGSCMKYVLGGCLVKGWNHIAMPLIGSGHGGLLPAECMRIIDETFKGWPIQVDVHVLPRSETKRAPTPKEKGLNF